ncbi:hypothetical protein DFJ77DRAFT_473495 [Powellomyces hirtus]|nr:hypothetical protein DFJ77DRAFT_473495 [Powellomyces hirtus]
MPCSCGESTHQRTSSRLCSLNRRNWEKSRLKEESHVEAPTTPPESPPNRARTSGIPIEALPSPILHSPLASFVTIPTELKTRICEFIDPEDARALRQTARIWNMVLSNKTLWERKAKLEYVSKKSDFKPDICATYAKRHWKLNAADLSEIKCVLKRNPRYRSAPPMRVYNRKAVICKSYVKHGGPDALGAATAKILQTTAKRKATIERQAEEQCNVRQQELEECLLSHGLEVPAYNYWCEMYVSDPANVSLPYIVNHLSEAREPPEGEST